MGDTPLPKIFYALCMMIGFGLLSFRWVLSGEMAGFFLMLFMICLTLVRWHLPWLGFTVVVDAVIAAVFYPWALVVAVFSGFYYRIYVVGVFIIIAAVGDLYLGGLVVVSGIAGLFLNLWQSERERGLSRRDEEASRYYELEALQLDLHNATARIERMTAISERARISREIHDNAGHEIVAAYISLQAVREMLNADEKALKFYDAALARLDTGVDKIREAVHNLAPVATLGVDSLREVYERFPLKAEKELIIFGNTANVPVSVWGVLEACLNEALTNISRHAAASYVKLNIDVTPKIIRMCVENDGVPAVDPANIRNAQHGNGLRNLRHRAAAAGGSVSIDAKAGAIFKIVCVIPINIGGDPI